MPDAPFRYKKLGYVAVTVRDLDRSTRFYRDTVGLSLTANGGGSSFFRCSNDHHNIALYQGDQVGLKRIAFEMESASDVDAARRHLKSLNVGYADVSPAEASSLHHRGGLRFNIPGCGLELELYSGMEQEAVPFEPKVAKILRLGHTVVKITHFQESFDFLTQQFGFRISDYIKGDHGEKDEVAFLRCYPSPYHHSLGIARDEKNQLHHFAFMVGDINDIGVANNRLKKANAPIVFGPGRHVASGSIFLYFLDPDGITIEYTLGMEEFAEDKPRPARKLAPTLETVDMWGGAPQPGFASIG